VDAAAAEVYDGEAWVFQVSLLPIVNQYLDLHWKALSGKIFFSMGKWG